MSRHIFILISCALLTSGTFGVPENESSLDGRIVGGFKIDIKQVPWQASYHKLNGQVCGTSIISRKWLLTAAHCVRDEPENSFVRIGSNELQSGGRIHKVQRVISHENNTVLGGDFDYALLEVQEPIEFDENVQPIRLIGKDETKPDDSICLVTGWGYTRNSGYLSEHLLGVEIPIINQQRCIDAYAKFNVRPVTPRMLCAGTTEGGRGTCQGDSGGPLVVYDTLSEDPVQIGIVSWSLGCAKYPSVFARVSVARDWIYQHTGI